MFHLEPWSENRGPLQLAHGASLDAILLLRGDRIECLDPAALDAEPIASPLDPLTPVHHVAALPAGDPIGDAELAGRLRLDGAALVAAQLLGIAEKTQELATAYARTHEERLAAGIGGSLELRPASAFG